MGDERKPPDLFDGSASRGARDEGVARVTENNEEWMDRAIRAVCLMPPMTGPFESWRRALLERGLVEPPKHHNAWGALGLVCQRRNILVPTGRYVHMKSVRSHARRTAELMTRPRNG